VTGAPQPGGPLQERPQRVETEVANSVTRACSRGSAATDATRSRAMTKRRCRSAARRCTRPRANDEMALELFRQSLQEGPTLVGMNRRGGRLDGGEFVVTEAERHGRGSGRSLVTMAPCARRLQEADGGAVAVVTRRGRFVASRSSYQRLSNPSYSPRRAPCRAAP
jgi:hypothetical protein